MNRQKYSLTKWTRKFFSRRQASASASRTRQEFLRPLGFENLESRRVLAVTSLSIIGITSTADTDLGVGGAEHVSVPAGATVTANFLYSSTLANATTAKFDVNTSPVTVSTPDTVVPSGAASASLSVVIPLGTAPGSYTAHVLVKNGTGSSSAANDSDLSSVVVITVDVTGPVITHTTTGTLGNDDGIAGTEGWYTSNVTVDWNATDPESTITSTSGADPVTITADGTTTVNYSATSAGGTSNASVIINKDATAPSLSATISSPDGNGWYNLNSGPAIVTYVASDATSGLSAPVPSPYTFSDGTGLSVSAITVSDNAGNPSLAAGAFTGINQDLVAPASVAVSLANDTGALPTDNITSDGTLSLSGVEGGATVEYSTDGGATWSASLALAEGSNTVQVRQTDVAGNVGPVSTLSFLLDTIAPVLSAGINSPAGAGWYNLSTGPAVVTYSVVEAGSGAATPAPYTFSDGANQSLADITVTDVAGNVSNAAGAQSNIDQDTVAPTLSASINSPAGTGWYNIATGPATVTYSASDAGPSSGVSSPAAYVFGDGAGQSVAAITVTDTAGNVSNSAGAFSGINQDTVAPTISGLADINTTPNAPGGANVNYIPPVSANGGTSGLASLSGAPITSGGLFPVGTTALIVTATDVAGNTATGGMNVTVAAVGVTDGNLWILGTVGGDCITTSASGTTVVVTGGPSPGTYTGVTGRVIAYLNGGDDCLTASGATPVEAHGGDGNDSITGGSGNDVIFGDLGNDTLTGSAGNDVLVGGCGNDRMVGSAGNDILIAGEVTMNYATLAAISLAWSASKSADSDLADNSDGDVVDTGSDSLTGGAGADWFIISSGDKITDLAKDILKDGDKVTIV